MDNTFIIIQARMSSTRLPGKVMLPLCGKPVLQVMLERLNSLSENIIIATTNDGDETPIVELCQQLNVNYFRGDTRNVLSRYYGAAKQYGAAESDTIVRLTSDCPLIDQNITRAAIEYYKKKRFDYISAGVTAGFPRGFDTEVFSFKLLAEANANSSSDFEREHVTPYIYQTIGQRLNLGLYKSAYNHAHFRLTLDEEEDYTVIKEVYRHFNCRTDFDYQSLIRLLENSPQISRINASVEQKKV